jgi:hypothetical protein
MFLDFFYSGIIFNVRFFYHDIKYHYNRYKFFLSTPLRGGGGYIFFLFFLYPYIR